MDNSPDPALQLTPIRNLSGVPVFCYPEDAPLLIQTDDVLDSVIAPLYGTDAEWVALPVSRLAPEFFDLSTRVAGEMLQKLVNYRLKVAIVGDVPTPSSALTAFIQESNRGRQIWFVPDLATLEQRLA